MAVLSWTITSWRRNSPADLAGWIVALGRAKLLLCPLSPRQVAQLDLTRIPKSKSSAAQSHRERTPLACGFRRLAENLVPQTFSRQNRTKNVRRRFGRAAPTGTRAACATILISEFGFKLCFLSCGLSQHPARDTPSENKPAPRPRLPPEHPRIMTIACRPAARTRQTTSRCRDSR